MVKGRDPLNVRNKEAEFLPKRKLSGRNSAFLFMRRLSVPDLYICHKYSLRAKIRYINAHICNKILIYRRGWCYIMH